MAISRRFTVASLLVAAAAGLAMPALVQSASEPRLVTPVELRATGDPAGRSADRPSDVPRDPVPVPPRAERRDDLGRSNVDEDDGPDDVDDDDGGAGGDDGATGRGGAGDDTDRGGSSDD